MASRHLADPTAAALWVLITAPNMEYQDCRCIIPLIFQFGLYTSPIGYRALPCPKAGASGTASIGGRHHRRPPLVRVGRESRFHTPGFLLSPASSRSSAGSASVNSAH
jgi:hypothetical protein